MHLVINGQSREISDLTPGAPLSSLLERLQLRADRIAVEQNGSIIARGAWPETPVNDGDKLEIVQFVGGGCDRGIVTEFTGRNFLDGM